MNGARPEDAHPALPVQAVTSPGTPVPSPASASAPSTSTRAGRTRWRPSSPCTSATPWPPSGPRCRAWRSATTGRWIQPDPRLRIEAVLAWGRLGLAKPDVCSVNVHELGWVEICNAAASVGIGVELGVWTSGDAVTLRRKGIPR